MDQNSPSNTADFMFVGCRALVYHCSPESAAQHWEPVGENNVFSKVELVQQNTPQGRILKIYGCQEQTGLVTLDIPLLHSIVYIVTEPTWHEIRINRQHVYGLALSPDSDGGRFSVVVQNSLKSLQVPVTLPSNPFTATQPPIPREAWMVTTTTIQSHLSRQPAPETYRPISPAVVQISPSGGQADYYWETIGSNMVGQQTESMASQTTLVRTPQPASPRSIESKSAPGHAQNQRSIFEEQADSLCINLSSAISRGDMAQATEIVKNMATKKLSLSVKLKNPMQVTVDPGNDHTIRLRVVVEDRETSGGAFNMKVSLNTTIEKLQQEVADRYGFPPKVQRWIIGKKMAKCKDTLYQCSVRDSGCTAFLYLVSGRSVGLTREDIQALQQTKALRTQQDHATNGEGLGHVGMNIDIAGEQAQVPLPQLQAVASGMQHAASMPSLQAGSQSERGSQAEGVVLGGVPSIGSATVLSSTAEIAATMPRPVNTPHPQGMEHMGVTMPNIPVGSIHDLTQFFADQQNQAAGMNSMLPRPVEGALNSAPQSNVNPVEDTEVVEGWACPGCTYMNTPTRPGCEMCGTERPADYVVPQNVHLREAERLRLEEERLQTQLFQEAQEQQRTEQAIARELNFNALIQTAQQNLIFNTEEFECAICFLAVEPGQGVVLRECLHRFCIECLREHIRNCTDPEVQCPYQDNECACHFVITGQEIKALLPEADFNKFLNRSLATAESQAANSFHCKSPNCPGWCIYEDNVNTFHCPVCNQVNCLTCKAIHYPDMNCREYQEDLKRRADNDDAARQTQQFLEEMIAQGDAMKCPQCEIILLKKDGCDWMRCSMCRLEICWATRGPRWGPGGVGDISAGCKCRVGGKKCHPGCRNCH